MNYRIALIGMMGSGKTTISKHLAIKLNCPLFDCDKIFEEENKISITDFFRESGESEFRKLETNLLKKIIKNQSFIISTGGGVILKEENRRILFDPSIKTFYLKTSPQVIYSRIKEDKTRPLLLVDNPLEEIEKIINHREDYYNQASYIINTDYRTIEEITAEILDKIL